MYHKSGTNKPVAAWPKYSASLHTRCIRSRSGSKTEAANTAGKFRPFASCSEIGIVVHKQCRSHSGSVSVDVVGLAPARCLSNQMDGHPNQIRPAYSSNATKGNILR